MSFKKVGIFIISRINSKRLPKKATLKVGKDNLIEFLYKRLKLCFDNNQIVICTNSLRGKEFYKSISQRYKIKIFFGENTNVLKRIIKCMEKYNFRNFARVTGDNPLTDPFALKFLINNHLKNKNDYTFTSSLPSGLRAEVFSLRALKKAEKNIIDHNSTEYLTFYFKRKDYFKTEDVKFKKFFFNEPNYSISIDYLKDYVLLKNLLKKNNNRYNISRKLISFFLKNNTKPIKLINEVPLKTYKYDVSFKGDKKKY